MKINEIFYSIQGEGVYSGVPMVFIRLQGCNLIAHCSYCDTSYAQDLNKGNQMDVDSIVREVMNLNPKRGSWICITGGEPLWQLVGLEALVRELKRGAYLVTVETNGSLPVPSWYALVDSWNVDIKCPSSGICGVSLEEWFNLREKDQIKFVVGTREDLIYAKQTIKRNLTYPTTILVSPTASYIPKWNIIEDFWSREWLQEVVEFCKEENVRFSLQLQKVIWGNKKGV